MKILIITLFVFVTNFVSSSVLADEKSKEELKSAVLKFKDKNNADLTISALENIILEIKEEDFQYKTHSVDGPTIEIQQKGLRALNCRKNKENKENNGKEPCSKSERDTVQEACKTYPQICQVRGSIDLYKPNYAMFSSSNKNDNALEVQYSGRYNFKKISCVKNNEKGLYIDYKCVEEKRKKSIQNEIFFSLTGKYDFYAFSDEGSKNRKSEPVINRFFNPALHSRFVFPTNSNSKDDSEKNDFFAGVRLEFIDFSFEHLSNGQRDYSKKDDFTAGKRNNYEESDSISISMFFPSISAQLFLIEKHNIKYKVFARAIFDYWGTELDIFSEDGDKIDKNDFPDYHRFKIGTILESTHIDDKWLLELSVTGHKKTSLDAFLSYPVSRIPVVDLLSRVGVDNLVFRYHNGYLSRLSNYDLKEQTIGIGFGVAF